MTTASMWLKEKEESGRGYQLLTHLNYKDRASWRWLAPDSDNTGAETWAVIPWHYLPEISKMDGQMTEISGPHGVSPVYLFKPEPNARQRLQTIDAQLSEYHTMVEEKRYVHYRASKGTPALKDPWAITASEAWNMTYLSLMGSIDEKTLANVDDSQFISAQPWHFPALYMARYDPAIARKMFLRAQTIDPRIKAP